MAKKDTAMVLNVDLQCPYCYKKVKEILCKFPQIKNQIYNKKANTVEITVVCCNPEKVRDKLRCKGANVIKSIEIEKSKSTKTKPGNGTGSGTDPGGTGPGTGTDGTGTGSSQGPDTGTGSGTGPSHGHGTGTGSGTGPSHGHGTGTGLGPGLPRRTCCRSCYEGYGGGPCYHGHGVPPPSQPCYCACYGYGYGYCHNRPCHVSKCYYYFSEENPQACSVM